MNEYRDTRVPNFIDCFVTVVLVQRVVTTNGDSLWDSQKHRGPTLALGAVEFLPQYRCDKNDPILRSPTAGSECGKKRSVGSDTILHRSSCFSLQIVKSSQSGAGSDFREQEIAPGTRFSESQKSACFVFTERTVQHAL